VIGGLYHIFIKQMIAVPSNTTDGMQADWNTGSRLYSLFANVVRGADSGSQVGGIIMSSVASLRNFLPRNSKINNAGIKVGVDPPHPPGVGAYECIVGQSYINDLLDNLQREAQIRDIIGR
jgi:hypothetical protein